MATLFPMRRRKSQSSATVVIDELMEYYTCPICFEEVSECRMTPCGHNFCMHCITECINVKHSCPLCSTEVVVSQLIRNHHFDGVVSKLQDARKAAAHDYVQKLMAS